MKSFKKKEIVLPAFPFFVSWWRLRLPVLKSPFIRKNVFYQELLRKRLIILRHMFSYMTSSTVRYWDKNREKENNEKKELPSNLSKL